MYENGGLGPLVRPLFTQVEVTCEIVVNGEKVAVRQLVDGELWADPQLRKHATEIVQMALLTEVFKKFPPPVTVRQ